MVGIYGVTIQGKTADQPQSNGFTKLRLSSSGWVAAEILGGGLQSVDQFLGCWMPRFTDGHPDYGPALGRFDAGEKLGKPFEWIGLEAVQLGVQIRLRNR
jgi:hypothetical protein